MIREEIIGSFPGHPDVRVSMVDDKTGWKRIRFLDQAAAKSNENFDPEAHRDIYDQLSRYAQSGTIGGWGERLFIVAEPGIADLIKRWIEGSGWGMPFGRFGRIWTTGEE